MIISFIQKSNCIDISKLMGFCVGAVFTGKKYGAYISQEYIAHTLSDLYQLEFDTIYLH